MRPPARARPRNSSSTPRRMHLPCRFQRELALGPLHFRFLVSRARENFSCFKSLRLWYLVVQPWEPTTPQAEPLPPRLSRRWVHPGLAHRNSTGLMAWICRALIQQRREPPMAMSRALVMVPLWSRYFCRTACRQGLGKRGQGQHTPTAPYAALTSVWFSRATSEASRATTVSLDVMFHWLISERE